MLDVEAALYELGVEFDTRNNEALALCPMHRARTGKEDNSPSWWINLETGAHMCFSCHYKGSILSLICDLKDFHTDTWGIKEYDFTAARAWLENISDITPDKLVMALSKVPREMAVYNPPIPMSEARLAIFVDPPEEELAKRHITIDSAQHYGIMWDAKKSDWILPIREPQTNKLMGWQEKGTINRTFRNHPTGLKMSRTLFGLDQMSHEGDLVLVESPLDCARMHSAGVPNTVAICGSNINEEQFKLIRHADRLIAAFDNAKLDDAGKKASEGIRKLASKYGVNLLFFDYGDTNKKDPGDLTNEEIAWGLEHAKSSLFGEKAYV